ncbi:MAG: GTP-binding protein [Planctomycetota bacterium]|jgi:bifunctional enzyme CysN/CysC
METVETKTKAQSEVDTRREQMDVVIVGHVDHGKSTVIGRLMADTGSLPEGKLEQIRAQCERNAKPFEYAFLLDALKHEQAQGITIDTARCFFKTDKRYYIIYDAPGHIEFLKNMVTGAAQTEAALLVIDAHEGIQENSLRHGYLLSLLGIRQISVLVNKMDLVDNSKEVFDSVTAEYTEFLKSLSVYPESFIPISARDGVNIAERGEGMDWYDGPTVLEQVDLFKKKGQDTESPFRMPVQDIYKFTEDNDDRRIVAGTIESGNIAVGDKVEFLPSGKKAAIAKIESFPEKDIGSIGAGQTAGFTFFPQIFIKPGELMVKQEEKTPRKATRFKANIFWMGHAPMIQNKRYKMKLGSSRIPVELAGINSVLDASELSSVTDKKQLDRHDIGECEIEALRPAVFDLASEDEKTARFVIIDDYEIAGCGVILAEEDVETSLLEKRVREREFNWDVGAISRDLRIAGYGHAGKFIVFNVEDQDNRNELIERAKGLAKTLERRLFSSHKHTYYLSMANIFDDLADSSAEATMSREEHLLQLGKIARIMTESGLLFITVLVDADEADLEKLRILNDPNELFVVNLGTSSSEGSGHVNIEPDLEEETAIQEITKSLNAENVIPDYMI